MSFSKTLLVLGLAGLLSACSNQLNGVYKDELGLQKYEFKDSGAVYVSTMGITREAKYIVEDSKVKITSDGDTAIYDLNEDGTIKGPLGMILRPESAK